MNLPEKAEYGKQCNRCGGCCAQEICAIGKEIYPDAEPPCPGLGYNKDHNKFACRLAQIEALTMPNDEQHINAALGIGKGCCSKLEDE